MYANQTSRIRTNSMVADADLWPTLTAFSGRRLHAAVAGGNIDEVKLALQAYPAAIHWQDDAGNTALHAALLNRSSVALVDALLEGRPNLFAENRQGDACIELAELLMRDAPELAARILYHAGGAGASTIADPRRPRPHVTPLMLAAFAGEARVIECLVALGADVDFKGEGGMTALRVAAFSGRLEAAKALLRCGANPNARDETGHTPMMAAAKAGHVELMRLLRDSGGDIKGRDNRGRTPLMHAYLGDQSPLTVARMMLMSGRDPLPDNAGKTLKMYREESVARQDGSDQSICAIV